MSRITPDYLAILIDTHRYLAPPPNWRWELARQTADSRMKPDDIEQIAGTWVAKAVEHLRSDGEAWPEIGEARTIHEADDAVTVELEARILTRRSDKQISRKMKLAEQVVAAYEAVFFDVRIHLSASSWVRIHAIRLTEYGEPLAVGTLLRYFAYFAGPWVLEQTLPIARRYATAIMAGTLAEVSRADPLVKHLARIIDLHSMEVTDENVMDLFRAHLALVARDRFRQQYPDEDQTPAQTLWEEATSAMPAASPPDIAKWAVTAA